MTLRPSRWPRVPLVGVCTFVALAGAPFWALGCGEGLAGKDLGGLDGGGNEASVEPDATGPGGDASRGQDGTSPSVDSSVEMDSGVAVDSGSSGDTGTEPTDAGLCGTCPSGHVCCEAPLGCAGMCVADCRMGGNGCPTGLTCDPGTGVCSPDGDAGMMGPPDGATMPPPDGGMMPPPDGGPPPDSGMPMDASTSPCGTCPTNDVCCESPLKCAGMCVPDCRQVGMCPSGLSCDTTTGVCSPGGGGNDGGGMTPPPDGGGMMPPPDGGMKPPDGGMKPPPDGGMMPPPGDGGASPEAGGGSGAGPGELGGGAVFSPSFDGNNVAISGATVALGLDSANCESGKADAYFYDGAQWSLQQTVSGTAGELECFGSSIALDGDLMVVGAFEEPQSPMLGALTIGAAFVYTRSGTTWTQLQELTSGTTGPYRYGWALAANGGQIVVGAPVQTANSLTGAGAVYVYAKKAQYAQQTTFNAPIITQEGRFGEAIALSGTQLVVSAPGDGTQQNGIVYGYTGSGSSWTLQSGVQPSDVAVADLFGYSVALSGYIMIAGSPSHASNGAAYIYRLVGSNWLFQQEIKATGGAAGDQFGYTVAALSETEWS